MASIRALDSLTLEIKLKAPHSIFLYALASPIGLVALSQQALQKYGDDIAYHPVGSGPFQFSEWIENEKIVLTSYPNYWQEKNHIDNLCFKFYNNNYEREQSIEEGDVDILYAISGYNVDRLKWLGTIDFYIQQPVSIIYIGFNNKSIPFNKIKLRKAILKSLDIPKFVYNINRGNADIARGPIPEDLLDYGNLEQENYDLTEALEILHECSYSNGLQVNLFFPERGFSRHTILELLKVELAKINISLNVTQFDTWEELDRALGSDSSQMFIDAYGVEVLGDPWNFLYSLFHSASKNNRMNYENPIVDSLLNQCAREFDSGRRSKLYRKIMTKILHDVPAVFLYHVKSHFAYNKNKIKRLIVNPYEIIQYHRLILNE
jgi:ABC-type transport system substrate-binding protein